jgi:hypothetical protein
MRMSFPTPAMPDEPSQETPSQRQPCCPVCNGALVELRGQYRCARCLFTFCVGCEAADTTSYCAVQLD